MDECSKLYIEEAERELQRHLQRIDDVGTRYRAEVSISATLAIEALRALRERLEYEQQRNLHQREMESALKAKISELEAKLSSVGGATR